ncbi:TPA: single-stranded DNA-binding protein [Streptococcus pyogenes]|uniref:single-stranded DNA-binding protein n=1 Tax=Streptococcus pyogenes TaxID=1314 RepID=UPI00109B9AAB|nr:single-stranded DNA-binding protein [Streptococcus pyogenes]HER4824350.1 single-stranded DNA-binding protein [Streptococcus pyogenes NGAS015]QCK44916.1 single-stranded DNA-binding protein [Streptococcus pyogenes]QCK48414.1 single-stranded DNA-binding protein [Streptococcus pyogenes]VGR22320.1 single-stranded DNA-binding protein [Streptococcus pyogenes]VGR69368.1 single-stranded DNA-binding protein [Streptococcus pyogenes]
MYNKVIAIGRLVAKPELVKTATDKHVARLSLAVNRRFKNASGEREADFISIVVWEKLAETLVSYASKGSLMSIDGELRTRKYDKDGQVHYVTEVLCQSFQLLESRAQRAMRENNVTNDLVDLVLEEDTLPF